MVLRRVTIKAATRHHSGEDILVGELAVVRVVAHHPRWRYASIYKRVGGEGVYVKRFVRALMQHFVGLMRMASVARRGETALMVLLCSQVLLLW